MPWIARHIETDARIDITQYENPRTVLKSGECVCQLCGQPLFIRGEHFRQSHFVRSHFAHLRPCDSAYDTHPESPEHLWAKAYLAHHLQQRYTERGDCPDIQLEVPIEMDWRPRGRQADLLVIWPLGWRVAHEIQLAAITPTQLTERTLDYQQAAIDVVWYLGKSADTPENRDWCLQNFGECPIIQWFATEVRDWYQE